MNKAILQTKTHTIPVCTPEGSAQQARYNHTRNQHPLLVNTTAVISALSKSGMVGHTTWHTDSAATINLLP